MTSSILPRAGRPAPRVTQAGASTTLDLPEPLGPTIQVMPGSRRIVVADAKTEALEGQRLVVRMSCLVRADRPLTLPARLPRSATCARPLLPVTLGICLTCGVPYRGRRCRRRASGSTRSVGPGDHSEAIASWWRIAPAMTKLTNFSAGRVRPASSASAHNRAITAPRGRVSGRHTGIGVWGGHRLERQALGEQVHERGIDVVDAAAPGRPIRPGRRSPAPSLGGLAGLAQRPGPYAATPTRW